MMPLTLFFWIVGFLITLLGGCWAIFKYFSNELKNYTEEQEDKIKRLYERMDDNKAQYYRDFILQKVYDSEKESKRENLDIRFESIVRIFTEKLDSMKNEIRMLMSRTKDHVE